MNSLFEGYQPYKGDIPTRYTGSLIASESGITTSYGLYNSQDRGPLFIGQGVPVYEGMIVGMNPKLGDIAVNVCRQKHLTAIRSSGADEALRLVTPIKMSLEVTPKNIRLRKKILDNSLRLKDQFRKK